MMKKLFRILILGILIISLTYADRPKGSNKDNKNRVNKALTQGYSTIAINNLEMWFGNDGNGSYNPYTANAGCYFPKGTSKTCIFQDGPVFAGLVGGNPRLTGSTYNQALQPGPIGANGQPLDASSPKYRIYQIRKDWKDLPDGPEKAKYQADYDAWPIDDGAPWEYNAQNKKVPKFIGDEQAWMVMNDLNEGIAISLYGTQPLGLEVHCLIWGYNQPGALGNILFKKYTLINKGSNEIDSMYIAYWSDVDDGEGTDDYSGCDTVLSIGYVYNGNPNDNVYGSNPPAVAYDYFQGPIVKGTDEDFANWNFGKKQGYKNLPMTSFTFFDRTAPIPDFTDPTLGTIAGGVQFYNLMKGLKKTGGQWINPQTGQVTKYVFPGDPVAKSGWIDGPNNEPPFSPGDKRITLSSGPFKMMRGDSQELVVGIIVGQGIDRLTSVTVMKFYDLSAQNAYNLAFKVPVAPPAPKVSVSELPNKLVLYWGDPDQNLLTENSDISGYKFEGYNVYQLPNASSVKSQSKLLATYDLVNDITTILDQELDVATGVVIKKPVQLGKNSGVQHSIAIDYDYIYSRSLVNGQRYYYAVTSYSYNPDPLAIPSCLENAFNVLTVIPQSLKPGYTPQAKVGETIPVTLAPGVKSDAQANISVIDPLKTTGHNYEISFDTVGHLADHEGELVWETQFFWKMVDKTTGKTVVAKNYNLTGDQVYPTIDGLFLKVSAPLRPDGRPGEGLRSDLDPDGKMGWTWSGSTRFIAAQTWSDFGLDCFGDYWGRINSFGFAGPTWFSGSSLAATDCHKVEIRFSSDASKQQKGYRYLRRASAAAADPAYVPFIINKTGTYPYQDYVTLPFTVWDVDASPAKQLACGFMENNEVKPNGSCDGKWRPTTASNGGREFLFIFNTPYTADPIDAYKVDIYAKTTPMMYFAIPIDRGYTFPNDEGANVTATMTLIPYYPVSKDVKFTFTAPAAVSYNNETAKVDVDKITVFPNPYYGSQMRELNVYNRYITFNSLPKKAKIKIFTLSGALIRTLEKNDDTQFLNWDLKNENRLVVASGMYIAYIEMPEVGVNKVIKIAVIMEAQLLDRI